MTATGFSPERLDTGRPLPARRYDWFLDAGTGIPTEPNPHQVARAAAPNSRVMQEQDPYGIARTLLDL
ncbi:SAM-dependent methyltransferase, partial [Streptomyces broussonetiae]|uniref:SAM-dependent methyltransferase n=1 Tax=Streptomyces broussonetiae TaxID=2686304 RepID=UPI0035DC08E9